jgi:3-phosphoshikimate 1-carboxyvinyltransferase
MRFVAAMAALGQGTYRLDGDARMRERPIGDLADALSQMGAAIHWEGSAGFPPIRVESTGLNGGRVTVRGEVSSQFLSALLLAAPYARDHTRIVVEGALVSKPYVRMTLDLLRTLGKADIRSDDELRTIWIRGKQRFPAGLTIPVEPDASAASYFFAAAAIAGGTIQVCGLSERHLQGDVRFAWVLKDMGCEVRVDGEGITVYGGPLRGIDVDMNAISDTVMTLAAVACFASRSTTIRNVAHIRHKETDRIAALATELRRVGMAVDEFADGLRIDPRPAHGAEIETYNDHRMAMSMALVGLRVPGIVITNPGCVAKTYPAFWRDFAQMRM